MVSKLCSLPCYFFLHPDDCLSPCLPLFKGTQTISQLFKVINLCVSYRLHSPCCEQSKGRPVSVSTFQRRKTRSHERISFQTTATRLGSFSKYLEMKHMRKAGMKVKKGGSYVCRHPSATQPMTHSSRERDSWEPTVINSEISL